MHSYSERRTLIPRARIPLLCVYVLLAGCGLISIFTPLSSVRDTVSLALLVKVWGAFFLLGGTTASLAITMRWIKTSALGWWYIEIAGICLLATSSLIYASVLAQVVLETHNINIAGLLCLILGLSSSLIERAWDAYRIAKLERQLLDELIMRDRKA